MERRGYFYVGFATTLNVILNALTLGRYVFLEGRVQNGAFRNWGRRFRYKPIKFFQPRTEEEIINLVKSSTALRVFGSGHSFNEGVVSDNTLVSLDSYSGVVWKNLATKQMAVRGGTRVRDIVRLLLNEGLAFRALPSHDAQSIAGILSTDVHGTGRDWGFVSQSVVSMKIIDGQGNVHECFPSDDLFKAAIGGFGAAGIIAEVVVQAVDRFTVEQKFEISDLSAVESNFDNLFQSNKHFSLYLFPFSEKCQISTWNQTTKAKSFLAPVREFLAISFDALLAAWGGNLMAYTGTLPQLSELAHSVKKGTDLVMESNAAFNRTIYHLHQELEFTVPFEKTFEMCRRFVGLYEEMYKEGLPYALFEVRFTPAGHDLTLIGAGRERHCTWIDLVLNDSHGFEKYYAAAIQLMKEVGARPHWGKYCEGYDKADLLNLHGPNFDRFLQVVERHDPAGKFRNAFTKRLLA